MFLHGVGTKLCKDQRGAASGLIDQHLARSAERIDLSRVEYKGSQIVNMSLDLLAFN